MPVTSRATVVAAVRDELLNTAVDRQLELLRQILKVEKQYRERSALK